MDYQQIANSHNLRKYLKKLEKKLKDKKIIIYGAGEFFSYINKHYDLSKLNIIGISDKRFGIWQEGELYEGYKIIPPELIKKYSPECILVTVLKYFNLLYQLQYDKNFSGITHFEPLLVPNFAERIEAVVKLSPYNNWILNVLTASFYLTLNNNLWHYKAVLFKKFLIDKFNKISKRYRRIKKRLRGKQKIRVVFHVFDDARWKYQSLYDLLEKDDRFEPLIVLSRLYTDNIKRVQTIDELKNTYQFFKDKGMRVELGYDLKHDKYISLKKFKPDYVFYQLSFYCHPKHSPEYCSNFALTAYVPYYTSACVNETMPEMEFRTVLNRYYLADNYLREYYSSIMLNRGENIRVVGHPQLDFYYLNKDKYKNAEKKYVIYTPHHSIEKNSPIKLSTFLYNGEFILNYAQSHQEINWVFRPHPLLKKVLKTIWTDEEIEKYYNAWKEVGIYDTDGNYLDKFMQSCLLINDSGLIYEYFPTGQPIIQLINKNYAKFDKTNEEIIKNCCYKVHNLEELEEYLDLILVKKQDPMKGAREKMLRELNINNNFSAQNILNDIKQELEINE